MARVIKIATGIFAVLVLAIGWFMYQLSGAPGPLIKPSRIAAPEGFDASQFVAVEALASNEAADVLVLNSFGAPEEEYLISGLGVSYHYFRTENGRIRVVFISRQGDVIGEIIEEDMPFPLGQFFVTGKVSYEIAEDGLSAPQPHLETAVDSVAEIEAMVAESPYFRSYSGSDVPGNDPGNGIRRQLYVMYHDGIWKSVLWDEPHFIDWKGAVFNYLGGQSTITRRDDENRSQGVLAGRYRLELTHFDQQRFVRGRNAMIGSTTGQGITPHWQGTGYYSLLDDGQPVLQFKKNNDRENISRGRGSYTTRLQLLSGEGLDFVIISTVDIKNQSTKVLVRPAQ